LVEKTGSVEASMKQAEALANLAASSLSIIPESQARYDLERLTEYIVTRDR
jgi:geranylgeranyl pyrophosphate synthase